MVIAIRETDHELGAEEKMIALKILLVIYLHDKRYLDAIADIEELLNDPEMKNHRECVLLEQNELRQILANSADNKKGNLLEFLSHIFNFLNPSR